MLPKYGTDGNDVMNGDANFNVLYGGKGNDTISGKEGNDKLYGEIGDDILAGGLGNDALFGGAGNDIYLYSKGDGDDTISDNEGINKIELIDLNPSDIGEIEKEDNDLVIKFEGSGSIRVKDYFKTQNLFAVANSEFKIQFADGSLWTHEMIEQGSGIYGTTAKDILHGTWKNESIYGKENNDTLFGEEGNDQLFGEAGNDTLVGSEGDDMLQGGEGSDTYIYRKGDGNDVINDTNDLTINKKSYDTIKFEGFNKADILSAVKNNESNDLVLTLKNSEGLAGENVTFTGWFLSDSATDRKIEAFKFDDGNISAASIENMLKIYGTDGNDVISGFNGNDTIYGGSGDDVIDGVKGNDTLYGEAGNDILQGSDGNDTLVGGEGNDLLQGAEGRDTYIYRRGDGNDVINDLDDINVAGKSSDTLKLEGFNKADIYSVVKSEQDLILTLKDTEGVAGNTIALKNWFYSDLTDPNFNYKMEALKFDDGALSTASIENLVQIYGTDADETINGLVGNDTIYAGKGNDMVYGNKGNDKLYGNEGDDTLYGEAGNDILYGGAGNNMLDGGLGTDTAVFEGTLSNYKILSTDGKQYVFKQNTSYNEIDMLLNIESLKFADQTKSSSYTNFTTNDSLKYIASYQEMINQYGISDAKGDWNQSIKSANKDFVTQGYQQGLGSFDSMGYLNDHKAEVESVFGNGKATEENGLKYYISHAK